MPKVSVYNILGEVVSEMELNPKLFDSEINEAVMHQVVLAHLAAKRQGTASTKSRGEVRGGGRKPWRQKGTGRARHGSTRSPIWVGGGIAFGPKPRTYGFTVPKKVRRLAMYSALSSKVKGNNLIVVDQINFETPKTKEVVKMLNNLKVEGKALIVTATPDSVVYKSARNIPGVQTAVADSINVYDLLKHKTVVMTQEAVKKVEEVFA
ncbi:50S ribosomal protein L4 [Anaerobranca gottschalkii]|uniref:Large ribosomal subunit protein uL4 n=1 Tax=Anaerobranca gottschalkii DSM 13577 TaxID=1120990 RepID=A0A1I0A6P4_9FIRM|nr:50S ribosomal protein L4 [Anaerobranca gottschalkii]SES89820.1 large subunit ribosomal protein L4 [Anaerobranca gottschalkii DSM 13577]